MKKCIVKVYVLSDVFNGNSIVLGVFSSKKKVTEAVEWLTKVDTYYKADPTRLTIETYEMNGERIED